MKLADYYSDNSAIVNLFVVLAALMLGTLIINLDFKLFIVLIASAGVITFVLFSPFLGICLLAFLGPFAGLMKLIPGALTANKLLGGLVAVSLLINLAVNRRSKIAPISTVILLYFLLAFLNLPSLLWSSDQLNGLEYISARISVVGLAFLVAAIIRNPEQLKVFCGCAAGGATLLGLYVVVFGMENLAGEYGERLAGGTNENVLAHALAVGLLLSGFLFIEASRARKAMVLLMDFFILVAIGLTGSRGIWLALIIVLIIIPLVYSRIRLRTRITSLAFAVTAMAGVGFGITRNLFGYWGQLVMNRVIPVAESSDISSVSGGRMSHIWPSYLEEFTKRPLFGGGFEVRSHIVRASHNDILSIMAEVGLIGLLVFVVLVWILFRELGRFEDHRIKIASFSLLWFLLAGGITHNTIYLKSFALVIGVLCCLPSIYGKGRVVNDVSSRNMTDGSVTMKTEEQ